MDENLENPRQEELKAWIKTQLNVAVKKIIKHGNVDSLIVEAKPAWVLPFQILIGKIRPQDQSNEFEWFICGEVPTDYLESAVASTPREAARHFAMKWQLGAVRYQEQMSQEEASGNEIDKSWQEPVEQLVEKAEALYALVDDTRLWLQDNE
jgi:hypothetical protein